MFPTSFLQLLPSLSSCHLGAEQPRLGSPWGSALVPAWPGRCLLQGQALSSLPAAGARTRPRGCEHSHPAGDFLPKAPSSLVTFTHPTCGDQGFPDGTEGAGSLSSYSQCAQTRKSQPTGACQAPGLKILKENNPPALLRPKKILGRFQNKYWWLCFVSSAGSRALALGSALAASPGT